MENSDVGQQGNMAEAAVESPAARFFCHRCTQEINPVLPDYTCPRCQSGFIEELAQGPPEHDEVSDEDVNAFSQIANILSMASYIQRSEDPSFGQNAQDGREGRNLSRAGPSRRARLSRIPTRRSGQDIEAVRTRAEGFLQQLVSTLSENTGLVTNASFPVFLNLHSNPGDYAWGRGGWNAIITQLINQLDGTGPPPLPKEKIDEIPIVNIRQEQVDKNLQCTVCMEDFKYQEPVRRLSCDHHFHNDCIIPWLELHGTCPICRKLLNDSSSQENIFSSSTNLPDVITLPGSVISQSSDNGASAMETDDMSRRNDSYNPHLPSVYDFTEEFD
ncbi:E3 ubiquitin-protein ligase RNF126-like [Stegodyphus dumicola]|uniref:E3 ubiquitin-protein ligase RNF126-like n=1 Tax=Stegodyphus dumicola TaxID=202533 RepID=UPI0015AA8C3A|nr:E3 ubiquitin-protein ligase RNF126-like [Stegodyphus dumicola]